MQKADRLNFQLSASCHSNLTALMPQNNDPQKHKVLIHGDYMTYF